MSSCTCIHMYGVVCTCTCTSHQIISYICMWVSLGSSVKYDCPVIISTASYWRSMLSQTCTLRGEVLHLGTKPLMSAEWILLKGACAGVHTVRVCRITEHSSRYTKLAYLQGQEMSAVCGVCSVTSSELTLDSWNQPEIRVWFMSSWLATVDCWLFRSCVYMYICIVYLHPVSMPDVMVLELWPQDMNYMEGVGKGCSQAIKQKEFTSGHRCC